jgi:hypothetical protein
MTRFKIRYPADMERVDGIILPGGVINAKYSLNVGGDSIFS